MLIRFTDCIGLNLDLSFISHPLPELCLYLFCVCAFAIDIIAMDYHTMYPWAPKNLLDKTSFYTSRECVVTLRKSSCHFGKAHDRFVRIFACKEDEPVCMDESSDLEGPLCFFYATFFKKVLLRLPLSVFEKELLTELNIASAQLHPNSLVFVHSFTIMCSQLDILLTVEVFLYFFEAKNSGRQLWVSLNGAPRRALLTLFQSSYKNFKGKFLKI